MGQKLLIGNKEITTQKKYPMQILINNKYEDLLQSNFLTIVHIFLFMFAKFDDLH